MQQRGEAAHERDARDTGERHERRIAAVVPAERERHAVEQHRGLSRVGPARGQLDLAARVAMHEHERERAQRLLEQRRRGEPQRVHGHGDGARAADRGRRPNAANDHRRHCAADGVAARRIGALLRPASGTKAVSSATALPTEARRTNGGMARGQWVDAATSAEPVRIRRRPREGGAATCGHRPAVTSTTAVAPVRCGPAARAAQRYRFFARIVPRQLFAPQRQG